MIAAIFFLLFGGFLTWTAVLSWRHRGEEKISMLVAVILKATCGEPLPLTRLDRILQNFLVIFALIFGPILLLVGIAMLINDIGSWV